MGVDYRVEGAAMYLTQSLPIVLVAFGLAMPAFAQKADGTLPRGDEKFLQKAAGDNIAEVELGKLAQRKALREEVKEFATRMVDDHTRANEALGKVAAAHSVALPTTMDAKHRKEMAKLEKLLGPEFDRAYMTLMVKDHRKDVKEFTKHAKSRKPNDATAFAAATLPILDTHLQAALATNDIVQASKRTGDRETGSKKM
jgi:putative membrane protein